MAKSYAVLYGQRGVKSFRSITRARDFAQTKANKMKSKVEIDRVTTYPNAKVGERDFSQTHYAFIKPKRKC